MKQSVGGRDGGRRRNISTCFFPFLASFWLKFITRSIFSLYYVDPGHTLGWLCRRSDPTPCKIVFYPNLDVVGI